MTNKQQDTAYFQQVVEDNKHSILRICTMYAVAPLEPEDLFQDVLFQIWQSLNKFQGKSALSTWVYRITLNVCMKAKLKLEKTNNRTTPFDSISFMQASETNEVVENEKLEFLKHCIAALEESDKSIIVLFLEDLSYRDIAQTTGISENHVAVKMKRIRKKLLGCITPKLT